VVTRASRQREQPNSEPGYCGTRKGHHGDKRWARLGSSAITDVW
jgi:hypothetical protein